MAAITEGDKARWLRQAPDLVGRYEALHERHIALQRAALQEALEVYKKALDNYFVQSVEDNLFVKIAKALAEAK